MPSRSIAALALLTMASLGAPPARAGWGVLGRMARSVKRTVERQAHKAVRRGQRLEQRKARAAAAAAATGSAEPAAGRAAVAASGAAGPPTGPAPLEAAVDASARLGTSVPVQTVGLAEGGLEVSEQATERTLDAGLWLGGASADLTRRVAGDAAGARADRQQSALQARVEALRRTHRGERRAARVSLQRRLDQARSQARQDREASRPEARRAQQQVGGALRSLGAASRRLGF